jgi:hypothetical protein
LLFVNITGNWKNRLAHTRQIIIADWLHSWPCRFHIMRASASSLWHKMCSWIFWQTWLNIVTNKKKSTLCKHRFRVTH